MHGLMRRPHRRVCTHSTRQASIQDPRWVFQNATYIICTNPRSGSWLLTEGLASTQLAGNPREWFNTLEEQQQRAVWRMEHPSDLSFESYLRLVIAKSMSQNRISGIKLHYYQFAELPQSVEGIASLCGLTPAQLLSTLFPNARFIWLTRRDKVRQAISLELAFQTDRWWSVEGTHQHRDQQDAPSPHFDPHAIAHKEARLLENDASWRAYFEENCISPFTIYYEDLIANYPKTIAAILKWLGVYDADTITVPETRLKRQSNALNEEWVTRYLAAKSAAGDGLALQSASRNADDPFSRRRRPFAAIPNAWRQWIARSLLLRVQHDAIIEVLLNNGYGRQAAEAEVRRARVDPYVLGAASTQRRLRKSLAILHASQASARLSSHSGNIERREPMSRAEFRDNYYAASRPVILVGLMGHWRAMTKWTLDYLKSVIGNPLFEMMMGRGAGPRHKMGAGAALLRRPEGRPLLQDFAAFPEYLMPSSDPSQCFLSLGPAGHTTSLQHSTRNVLVAQVTGRKRYRLISAAQWPYLYNRVGIFSEVDCERPDLLRYPKFRYATIAEIVLEAGEVLFIPAAWWHHSRALEASISLCFTNFVFPNHYLLEP